MSWSGNELRAQVTKAARGLGYDWGRAKYLGESVLRAERNGLSALASFLQLIDTLDTGPSHLLHSRENQGYGAHTPTYTRYSRWCPRCLCSGKQAAGQGQQNGSRARKENMSE